MKKIYLFIAAAFLVIIPSSMQGQDRKQPNPGPAPTVHITKPKTFVMANGLTVMLVQNDKLPRVSYSLTIDNPLVYQGDKTGVSNLLSAMLGGNTKTMDKEKYNEEIDFLGVSMRFSSMGGSASGLSKYNEQIISLLSQGTLEPVFTQLEFDKVKAQQIEGVKSMDKSVSAISNRVNHALLYGKDTPVGEFETENTLSNIQLADVQDYYKKYFIPNKAYLVVVGDIDVKQTEALIRKHFGKWKKENTTFPNYNLAKNVKAPQIDFVDMSNAVQSEIALVNQVELKMNDKDYFAALLANQVLGGGGEGRLFLNLREAHGWTYGAYSSLSPTRNYPGMFLATASVRNVVTDSAVTEFMKEIDLMRNTLVSEEELAMAKSKYIGNFVMEIQKPATIARYALFSALYNLPNDFYENYIKNIQSVTAQDIQKAAQKYFLSENMRIIIVGKASEVLQGLESLQIPINYYNTQADPTEKPSVDVSAPVGTTVNSVVNKYLNAIGGVNKLKEVKSVFTQATASVQGMEIEFDSKIMTPGYSLVTQSMGGTLLSKVVITPQSGYTFNQGVKTELTPEQLLKAQKEAYPFVELNWIDNPDVTLGQLKTVDSKKCVGLKVGNSVHYYDLESGLKYGIDSNSEQDPNVVSSVELSDYKQTQGIWFPMTQTINMGIEIQIKTKDIKVNQNVSLEDFN
ncbi:M16 family metallopeptidase [Myroides sp. LJL115]